VERELQKLVAGLFERGEVQGLVGLRSTPAEPLPHLFTDPAGLESLTIGTVRYPMAHVLRRIAARHPEATLAVVCRACDERAVFELAKHGQLSLERVRILGIACSPDYALPCACDEPTPRNLVLGGPALARPKSQDVEEIDALALPERLRFWTEELGRCIKCYGCRDACPVCFCRVCTLQDDALVRRGEIPAELPAFQLTRAMHMAGRCIDCGLCEEACPMQIPVRTIYRKVRQVVGELTGYWPGLPDGKSPLTELGDGTFPIC